MDHCYICYCGLYCENCATKANVEPAARALYREMQQAGFEDVVQFLPDGEAFWRFLKRVAEEGTCVSCRDGGGNPGCEIRICARQKGVAQCALCDCYPCRWFDDFLEGYSTLKADNELLRNGGLEQWAALQDRRKANGCTYTENR